MYWFFILHLFVLSIWYNLVYNSILISGFLLGVLHVLDEVHIKSMFNLIFVTNELLTLFKGLGQARKPNSHSWAKPIPGLKHCLGLQNFTKEKCIFLSLRRVWQTCHNEFLIVFFANFFFCQKNPWWFQKFWKNLGTI